MKKVISCMLLIALFAAFMVPTVYAAGANVTVSSASADRGNTVTLAVSISGNPGFMSGKVVLNYDKSALRLDAINPVMFVGSTSVSGGSANHASPENVTGDGVLFNATFTILDSAAAGSYTVSASASGFRSKQDTGFARVDVTAGSGSITVTIPPCAVHTYGELTGSEPTCTEAGVKTQTCSVCGHVNTVTTPATGHTYGDWEKVDDTNHKKTCACGDVVTAAHTWNAGEITKPASCVDGEKTFTCTADGCGATKVEAVKGTGIHTTNTWTDAGDGKTHKGTCAGCGNELTADHMWDLGTVTKQPSCNEAGVKTFKCTFNCGAEKTEEIKATGFHVYTDSYVDNGDGKTHVGVCACGTKSTIAQNHILVLKETINPDCKNDGKNVYECNVCKGIVETVLESTGKHNFETWTTDGEKTHTSTCTGCGEETKTEDHVWNKGEITTEPGCETKGVKTYTCTAKGCGQTKTEEVAETGHKMQLTEKVAATCVAEGVEKYACANKDCDKTEEKVLTVDPAAHTLVYTNNEETENHTVSCANGCAMQPYFEDHNHNIFGGIVNGKQEKLCACGDKIEVALGGNYADLDNVPKTGDITGQIVAFAACGMAALMAVAFVFKRKAVK